MAFCPHCGKSVTDQASKCLACGKEFEPRAKGARFKGTMMMSPGTAAALPQRPVTPAGGTEQPAAAAPAPAPVAQPAPAPRAPTPAPSKVGKATMLGTGGAGLAPPPGRPSAQQGAMPKAPPPAAAAPAAPAPIAAPPPAAIAASASDEGDPALADTKRRPTEPAVAAAAAAESTEREDSQRFLVGDPMAPSGSSAQTGGRSARRSSTEEPVIPGVNAPGTTGKLIGVAIGGIVAIALVGYLAARFMGLLN
jgi:hypothetical protein